MRIKAIFFAIVIMLLGSAGTCFWSLGTRAYSLDHKSSVEQQLQTIRAGQIPKLSDLFPSPPPPPVPLYQPPPLPGHLGLRVSVGPDIDDAETAQTIATQMRRGNLIPFARIDHYRWLDAPEYRVDGWNGELLDLKKTSRGHVITMKITPQVTSVYGQITVIMDTVHEKYELRQGKLKFLGLSVPAGSRLGEIVAVD